MKVNLKQLDFNEISHFGLPPTVSNQAFKTEIYYYLVPYDLVVYPQEDVYRIVLYLMDLNIEDSTYDNLDIVPVRPAYVVEVSRKVDVTDFIKKLPEEIKDERELLSYGFKQIAS
jgi:hypothetical protein